MAALLELSAAARILIVAGLHTGRSVISHFFHVAEERNLTADDEGIQERNVIDGSMRLWSPEKSDEDIVERKKWLIVAKLKWRALV